MRYKAYITDSLNMLNKIIATHYGGSYLSERWVSKYVEEDERSGDEVALDVFKRAGLRFEGQEQWEIS